MHTQCPYCETNFRITKTQLDAADGFVRCGICQQVFNAIELAGQQKNQPSLSDAETANTTPLDENSRHSEYSALQPPAEKISAAINESALSDEAQSTKETFDFFHEDGNEAAPNVVPNTFRNKDRKQSKSLITTTLWSIGTLLLSASLVVEYAWFNRNQLSQRPELQTVVKKLCQRFECKNFSMRNPAKIELVTRNIYSHPNEKDALMVNVTMKNNARFAQPYPIIQIDFSDIRGGNVAARRFFPDEYMPMQNDTEALHLIQPATETTVTLEIQDPGKKAMTYEFDFL